VSISHTWLGLSISGASMNGKATARKGDGVICCCFLLIINQAQSQRKSFTKGWDPLGYRYKKHHHDDDDQKKKFFLFVSSPLIFKHLYAMRLRANIATTFTIRQQL
jgi:hypothetical protein